jgi:hypothetical protein
MSSSCPVTQVTLRFLIRLSHGFCHAEVNVALKKILKGLFGCKHGIIWEPWPRTTAVSCDKLSASITHGDIIWSCALTFPGCFLCQYAKHPKPSSKPILFDGGWWLRLSENDVKFTNFWFFCESLWSIAGIRCSPAGGVPLFQWEPNTKPLSASLTHSILPEGFASRIFKKWIFQELTPTICPSN